MRSKPIPDHPVVPDRGVRRVFNDTFRYVRETVGERDAVLDFMLEIDGASINGVDIIKVGQRRQVTEFKVMLRPLKAINLIREKMGAMLQAKAQ